MIEKISITQEEILSTSKERTTNMNEVVMGMGELVEYVKPYNKKISQSTIYKWIMLAKRKRNTFPFHKRGKNLYFFKPEIDKWFRSDR